MAVLPDEESLNVAVFLEVEMKDLGLTLGASFVMRFTKLVLDVMPKALASNTKTLELG